MAGPVGLGLPGGHVGSWGVPEIVGLGLLGGHVGSRGRPGAVGLRLLMAMLVPEAWR